MVGAPTRVFTMLTDRDSIATWLPPGAELTPNDHGAVRAGDTIRVSTPRAPGDPNRQQRQVWVVRELVEPVTLVFDGIEYNPAGVPHVGLARHDSLVPSGDSTTIISTFQVFPTVLKDESPGRMATATLRAADQLRLGAAKTQWRVQLRRLAAHLSGRRDSVVSVR
jgi:uncharacterized protein YndB with AHSA1/START domain